MKVRDREIRRRRARRRKTRWLKERLAQTNDSKRKSALVEKLKKVNPFLRPEDLG
jgi:hypothetical protein